MVAEFTGHTQSTPEEFGKAERVVQRMLNNRLFPHGSKDHPQFLTSGVTISTGLEEVNPLDIAHKGKQSEVLRVTLKDPHIDTMPLAVKEATFKTFAEIPALKENVAFESPEEHVKSVKNELQRLQGLGADIPPQLLQWRGFNPESAGTWNDAPDHALSINKDELSTTVYLNTDDNAKKVAENLRARLPEIKKTLGQRVAKYKGITDDAGKQAIAQQIEKMDINLSFDENASPDGTKTPGSITLSFASKEQTEALKNKRLTGAAPPDQLALTESNILNNLKPEQLGKALGRSILFAGEGAMDVFPLIAGREDMRRVVTKKLKHFQKEHPEHVQCVENLLKDDVFKDHQQYDKPASKQVAFKQAPRVNKDPSKPDEMTIDFILPEGKAWEAIQSIAALDPQMQSHTAAASEHAFAHVDNIELIGVTGPDGKAGKKAAAQANELIAAFRQTQQAMQSTLQLTPASASAATSSAEQTASAILARMGGTSSDQAIIPLAEKVVEGVVKANQAIANAGASLPKEVTAPLEEAGRAVQEAMLIGSLGPWTQRETARAAERGQGRGAA